MEEKSTKPGMTSSPSTSSSVAPSSSSLPPSSLPDRPSSSRPSQTRFIVFLSLFIFVYLLEACGGMYILSALQNIEKQFRLSSRKSGFLISASDFGYIPTVILISYLGARGNRARWIGAGTLGMAAAYLLIASPNFLFPNPPVQQEIYTKVEQSLDYSYESLKSEDSLASLITHPIVHNRLPSKLRSQLRSFPSFNESVDALKSPESFPTDSSLLHEVVAKAKEAVEEKKDGKEVASLLKEFIRRRGNHTGLIDLRRQVDAPFSICSPLVNGLKKDIQNVRCEDGQSSHSSFLILFLGLLILGIGKTLPWSLGIPMIDDNVSRKNMPAYFGGVSFIRIIGPISGFLLASVVNKFYYNFNPPPGLRPEDSSWIGAWWIGFLLIGACTLIPSISLCIFPSAKINIPSSDGKHREIVFKTKLVPKKDEGRIKNFFNTYKQILKNKVYIYSATGRVVDMLALRGFMVFLPKYLENHFGIARYLVHRYMAIFGVLGFAAGSGIGGLLVKRLRISGKGAALWVLIVSFLNILLFLSKTFITCESVVSSISNPTPDAVSRFNLSSSCNHECSCSTHSLYPVCDINGVAYFSPCHAGCREAAGNRISFSSCDCVPGGGSVSKESCKQSCTIPAVLYFTAKILSAFCAGLGIVPGLLILIRSVPPETRSAALGLQGFLVSLFGTICIFEGTLPSPIIWGLIVDSTCRIWEQSCVGQRGSCSVYDASDMRIRLHLTYIFIRSIALINDYLVYREADSVNIIESESEEVETVRNSIKMRELSVKL